MYHSSVHANVQIGKESAWGTPVTANKDIGLVQNVTINGDMNYTRVHGLGSVSTQNIASGRFAGTGSLEVIVQHMRLLEYILGGTVSHVDTDSPDIQHVFTESTTTTPSCTMDVNLDSTTDIVHKLSGVKFQSMTLSLGLDGYLTLKGDFAFKNWNPSGTSATAASISTLQPYKDFLATLKFGAESSEVEQTVCQSLEVTINNVSGGTATIWGIESKLLAALEATQRTIDLKWTMAFQDVTALTRFLGSASGALDTGTEIATSGINIDITNGVALKSGRREVYLDLSGVYITKVGVPIPIGSWILVTFDGYAKTIDSAYSYDNILSAAWG